MSFDRELNKKDVYIHNGILLSQKKRWNTAICKALMALENIMLSEISQSE